jgi:hypothetical protein
VTAADDALAYLRREHRRLRPLVVVYCANTDENHRVIRIFRTRWGPYLWPTAVRWGKSRDGGKSVVYQDGLIDVSDGSVFPYEMELLAGCRCGVQTIGRAPVWDALLASMGDGKRRVLRAAPKSFNG